LVEHKVLKVFKVQWALKVLKAYKVQ
jgi:hypothetical protein